MAQKSIEINECDLCASNLSLSHFKMGKHDECYMCDLYLRMALLRNQESDRELE